MTKTQKMNPPPPPPEEEEQPMAVPPEQTSEAPPADAPPAEGAPVEQAPPEEMPPEELMKALKETLSVSKKLVKQNEDLRKELADMKKARPAVKGPPPGDDAVVEGELPTHNDDNRVRGKPHREQAVGAVENYREPTKENPKVFGKALDSAVQKAMGDLDERVTRIVKAHTPLPQGYRDTAEGREFAKMNIKDLVRKAIEEDRRTAGGSYATTESFGWQAGKPATRVAVVKMLRKGLA